jgi:acetyl/propionyl-CoA carboxylase alpha subunit
MLAVLDRFHVDGIDTTIPFHKTILGDEMFWDGHIYTKFVEDRIEAANKAIEAEATNCEAKLRQNEVLLETVRELMTV